MGGAGSGRNHPGNQAPDINCRSISSFLGFLPGKEGAVGSHNDYFRLYRFQFLIRDDLRIDVNSHIFRISRPETILFGFENADGVTRLEGNCHRLDAAKHADRTKLIERSIICA
jgi:hypothetical protein